MGLVPEVRFHIWKSINSIHQINRRKKKIISTDVEKHSTPLHDKNTKKLGIGDYLDVIKSIQAHLSDITGLTSDHHNKVSHRLFDLKKLHIYICIHIYIYARILRVFTAAAFLISFKNFSFAFTALTTLRALTFSLFWLSTCLLH